MGLDYELRDGVLRIFREMELDYDVSFDKSMSELIACPEQDLVIDLSRISCITSTYIGLMAAAFFQARARGKSISILARGRVLKTLRMVGFENFIKLKDSGRLDSVGAEQ